MSLLDGKYEIIAQRPLADHQTLFEATAPEGTQLNIVWYDLPAEQEAAFETYRRTLKSLMRGGHTALYDVVSRPGACYVAWERPPEGSGPGRDPALERLLEESGIATDAADIRRSGRNAKLYALAFGGVTHRVPEHPQATADTPSDSGKRRPLPAPLLSWGASAVMLTLAFVLLLGGMLRNANDRLVVVPDLQGRPVGEAIATLYDLGFAVVVHEVAAEAPTGTVVDISPAPGSQLRPGRSIDIGFALPPGRFAPTVLPQLVGRNYPGEAEAMLDAADLELGRVARIAAAVPGGVIIAQSPAAGDNREQGTPVDILVSDGPLAATTFLPDLVGLNEEDARYFAELAGLRPDRILIDRVALAGTEPGTVVSQSLAPFQLLAQSTTLRLVLSADRSETSPATAGGVPSLIGLSRDQAERMARASGLAPSFVERSVEQLPEGVVLQTPGPGSEATGNGIALVLNVHPLAIPIPEVVATVVPPKPRSVGYRWIVEQGIPEVTAVVSATTLQGVRTVVDRRKTRGGEILEGVWITDAPGPISFTLTLNGAPYGEVLRMQ